MRLIAPSGEFRSQREMLFYINREIQTKQNAELGTDGLNLFDSYVCLHNRNS